MSGYRVNRALLLEKDPEELKDRPALTSIRDADWRHQRIAMIGGYSSVMEMAIDELITLVRELQERVDKLEGNLHRIGWATGPLDPELDP